jgi:Domain of unknown function (DUF4124)
MRNTLTSLFAAAILAISCVSSLNAAAKVYKWTDENGQVHFSSTPPAGKPAETVRIRKGVDAAPVVPDTSTAQTDANAKPGDKPKMTDEQRAELSKYCVAMRERISTLKQGGRLIEKNPDGSQTPLDVAGVDERLRTDETNVRNYCTANGL